MGCRKTRTFFNLYLPRKEGPMSEDMRTEIRRLLKELAVPQTEVCRRVSSRYGYPLGHSELCTYLAGLNTPKAQRALTDALSVLTEEKMRRKAILDVAKRV